MRTSSCAAVRANIRQINASSLSHRIQPADRCRPPPWSCATSLRSKGFVADIDQPDPFVSGSMLLRDEEDMAALHRADDDGLDQRAAFGQPVLPWRSSVVGRRTTRPALSTHQRAKMAAIVGPRLRPQLLDAFRGGCWHEPRRVLIGKARAAGSCPGRFPAPFSVLTSL